MIITKYRLTFLLFFLITGGCNGEKSRETVSANPFKAQVDAVSKAKEVEQLIHAQAAQRGRLIEDQIKR